MYLRTLVFATKGDGTVLGHTVGPEAAEGGSTSFKLATLVTQGIGTSYPDMASWVKRSQNPKTGLARTSRTA